MKNQTLRRWLTFASLLAGVAFTATAEYRLAVDLGANPVIAAMLPVTIDCYVIAALQWTRAFDVALSLSLMGAAQIAAHALDAGVLEVDLRMVVVVSLLVPVAIWRTHLLARSGEREQAPPEPAEPRPEPVVVEQVPPEPAPPPAAPVLPVWGPFTTLGALEHTPGGTGGGTGLEQQRRPADEEPEPEVSSGGTGAGSGPGDLVPDDVPPGVSVEHVADVRRWLADEPELTGTAIGTRLGTSDSYGRRVRRAALNGAVPREGVRS